MLGINVKVGQQFLFTFPAFQAASIRKIVFTTHSKIELRRRKVPTSLFKKMLRILQKGEVRTLAIAKWLAVIHLLVLVRTVGVVLSEMLLSNLTHH